jgi:hypothetical protein
MFYELLVVSTNLYLQAILLKEVGVTEVMIQVTVSGQQVNGLQLLLTKIVVDSLTFLLI